jgi:hypothetical protein
MMILDYLGVVGGIFEIIKVILEPILVPIATHFFYLKAISSFYIVK